MRLISIVLAVASMLAIGWSSATAMEAFDGTTLETTASRFTAMVYGFHGDSRVHYLTETESALETDRKPGLGVAVSFWRKKQLLDIPMSGYSLPLHVGGRASFQSFKITTPIEHAPFLEGHVTYQSRRTEQFLANFLLGTWIGKEDWYFHAVFVGPGLEFNRHGQPEFYLIQYLAVGWKQLIAEIGWGSNFNSPPGPPDPELAWDTHWWLGVGYQLR